MWDRPNKFNWLIVQIQSVCSEYLHIVLISLLKNLKIKVKLMVLAQFGNSLLTRNISVYIYVYIYDIYNINIMYIIIHNTYNIFIYTNFDSLCIKCQIWFNNWMRYFFEFISIHIYVCIYIYVYIYILYIYIYYMCIYIYMYI